MSHLKIWFTKSALIRSSRPKYAVITQRLWNVLYFDIHLLRVTLKLQFCLASPPFLLLQVLLLFFLLLSSFFYVISNFNLFSPFSFLFGFTSWLPCLCPLLHSFCITNPDYDCLILIELRFLYNFILSVTYIHNYMFQF